MKRTPLKRGTKSLNSSNGSLNKKPRVERVTLGLFFENQINKIKLENIRCEECGCKLKGMSSEVCHIISKSTNPEVGENVNNIVYLCGMFSDNQCHSKFDSSLTDRLNMNVFPLAKNRYQLFKNEIKRKTNESLQMED